MLMFSLLVFSDKFNLPFKTNITILVVSNYMSLKVIPTWQVICTSFWCCDEGSHHLQILGRRFFLFVREGQKRNYWKLSEWGTDPACHYVMLDHIQLKIFVSDLSFPWVLSICQKIEKSSEFLWRYSWQWILLSDWSKPFWWNNLAFLFLKLTERFSMLYKWRNLSSYVLFMISLHL